MQWLHENAFTTPLWLLDKTMLQNIDYAGYTERLRRLQSRYLNGLLSFDRLGRLIDHSAIDDTNYSVLTLMKDLRKGIWSEVNLTKNVDVYRRNLQRGYIDRMAYLMTEEIDPKRRNQYFNVSQSDIRALVRGELNTLKRQAATAGNRSVNTVTKYHYGDIVKRIEEVLDPK